MLGGNTTTFRKRLEKSPTTITAESFRETRVRETLKRNENVPTIFLTREREREREKEMYIKY